MTGSTEPEPEPEYQIFTCMACEFTSTTGLMMTAHQSICEELEPEKQSFRLALLTLEVPGFEEQAQDLARKQATRQKQEANDAV